MFENIKSRLGFKGNEYEDEYEDVYDAYSDNYDDFSTYEEEDNHEDTLSYSPYSPPVTTRDAGARRRSRSSFDFDAGRGGSHPRLVSYDDVRASTQVPESLSRDPLPPRRSSSARSGGSAAGASAGAAGTASSGYDSLFEPTGSAAAASPSAGFEPAGQGASSLGGSASATAGTSAAAGASATAGGSAYDPYQAYEGNGVVSHRPSRNVVVLTPMAYNEVEDVARTLRAGDLVVLSLRNTPNQLSKRVLDFSFGVASALDGSVDCIADKVFVITRGTPITDAELSRLRGQGVL